MPTIGKRLVLAMAWTAGAALAAGSVAATPAYHAAQSAQEQTLLRVLKADENPAANVNPIDERGLRRPRTTPPPGAPYLKVLTAALAKAILAAEAREVKANCGGVYKRGELCGMDSDAIVCAQDFPDHYLFRTTESAADRVVIEAAWPPDQAGASQPSASGEYRLTLSGGVWKIDGISCAEGDRYNWPAR